MSETRRRISEPDFADEPVVVVDGPLDGFADQYVGRHAAAASCAHRFPGDPGQLKARLELQTNTTVDVAGT